MKQNDELKGAQKAVELAEKVEAMTKTDAWKIYSSLLDQLLQQETAKLLGHDMDQQFYRQVGFVQMLTFIKDLPNVLKDKNARDYLLHQGRRKALQMGKLGVLNHIKKQKTFALQKLQSIMGGNLDEQKRSHGEQVYEQQG